MLILFYNVSYKLIKYINVNEDLIFLWSFVIWYFNNNKNELSK